MAAAEGRGARRAPTARLLTMPSSRRLQPHVDRLAGALPFSKNPMTLAIVSGLQGRTCGGDARWGCKGGVARSDSQAGRWAAQVAGRRHLRLGRFLLLLPLADEICCPCTLEGVISPNIGSSASLGDCSSWHLPRRLAPPAGRPSSTCSGVLWSVKPLELGEGSCDT